MQVIIERIKHDWERAVFAGAIIVFIITGLLIAIISLDFFGSDNPRPTTTNKVDQIYSETAFAFLNQENINPRSTAFEQQEAKANIPRFKPPKKYVQKPKVIPKKPVNPVNPKVVAKPPTPKVPPVEYYIRYVGYMESVTGEMRAWLKSEQVQSKKVLKSELLVSEEGDLVNKYIVTSFDEKQVILQKATGGTLIINKGDRAHIATVQP